MIMFAEPVVNPLAQRLPIVVLWSPFVILYKDLYPIEVLCNAEAKSVLLSGHKYPPKVLALRSVYKPLASYESYLLTTKSCIFPLESNK